MFTVSHDFDIITLLLHERGNRASTDVFIVVMKVLFENYKMLNRMRRMGWNQ